jgi:hypothetical protein
VLLALTGSPFPWLHASAPRSEQSTTPGGNLSIGARVQISSVLPDGDPARSAYVPLLAFNSTDDEYLVAWAVPTSPSAALYVGQRIDARTGAHVGETGFPILQTDNLSAHDGAYCASLAYNRVDNEYLFVAPGGDMPEVYGQRLTAAGEPIGSAIRLTELTVPGDTRMGAGCATIVHNPTANEYLLVWVGINGWGYRKEIPAGYTYRCAAEVYLQRLSGSATPSGPAQRLYDCLEFSFSGVEMWSVIAAAYNVAADEYVLAWTRYAIDQRTVVYRATALDLSVRGPLALPSGCGTPSLAVNAVTAEDLVVWNGCGAVYAGRMADGTLLETILVGLQATPIGPAVAYDASRNEYLVVFSRPDTGGDIELSGQVVSGNGRLIGSAVRISQMGPVGEPAYGARDPTIAYRNRTNQYFVVWTGDDDTAGHVDEEFEVYGRRYVPAEPYVIGLAGYTPQGGWIEQRSDSPSLGPAGWLQVPWPAYNATGGGTHPAMGDVDADGHDEIVIGLEASGQNWLLILDDSRSAHVPLRWLQLGWPHDGTPIYPAVGNLDADRGHEIVLGLGPQTGGWFLILDDAAASFAPLAWRQVAWPAYTAGDGRTHPAIGDVTGDGVSEIIVGLGPGAAGWVEIVNGAASGYTHRAWVQVPWSGYAAANGTAWPAAGDVDGDGIDELVLGLGRGGEGWLAVLDDEPHGYQVVRWLQVGWRGYDSAVGETHPAAGDIDGDPASEIVVGFAAWAGDGGWFQIFDDLEANTGPQEMTWRQITWEAFNAAGGGTYPAVAKRRGPARDASRVSSAK